tara:strand:+ start:1949 stop:2224 length:276 start_codon:yes stop_codon:yes gene_type:complete
MKILKAKLSTANTEIFQISDLAIANHGFVLEDILNGADMINPIEVHQCTNEGTMGALGKEYKKNLLKVVKGSQRVTTAIKLGYTHIEGYYV